MSHVLEELNKTKQKDYNNAKKDLLQAKDSFSHLDNDQKHQLVSEFIGPERIMALFSIIRQCF